MTSSAAISRSYHNSLIVSIVSGAQRSESKQDLAQVEYCDNLIFQRRAALDALGELTAQATLEQIRRGACYDVRRLFDKAGNYKPIHTLTAEEAAMIAGVEVLKRNLTSGDGHTDVVLKIRLVDRARYVEMAAKYHRLLTEVHEHLGDWDKLASRLASVRKRDLAGGR